MMNFPIFQGNLIDACALKKGNRFMDFSIFIMEASAIIQGIAGVHYSIFQEFSYGWPAILFTIVMGAATAIYKAHAIHHIKVTGPGVGHAFFKPANSSGAYTT